MQSLNIFEDYFPSYIQDKIIESIPNVDKKGDKWNFRCPICGDSKKSQHKARGWYYLRTNSYHCFNCGANCFGIQLIAAIDGITVEEVKREFVASIRKSKAQNTPIKQKYIVPPQIPKRTLFKLKDSWIPDSPIIDTFISSRKLDTAPFKPNGWKLWFDTEAKRIVIPWMRNGEMKTYQLRAVLPNQQPKYMFPANAEKDVFGLDSIDDRLGMIFMFEGALDSIFCVNGVAIGGVNLTEHQKELLKTYFSEKVLFLDNQNLDKTAKDKMLKVIKSDIKQKMFIWPKTMTKYKDVNEHIISEGTNPFVDLNFLKSRVFSGARALLELKTF